MRPVEPHHDMRGHVVEPSFAFATRADLPAIAALLSECALPADDVQAHVDHFVVARYRERLVGVVGLELADRAALLRSLAVEPAWRNRGVARALYARILAHARLLGIEKLYLLTTTARAFFAKLGFATCERSEVPSAIAATAQFRSLCPSTAVCMVKDVSGEARYFPSDVLR